MFSEQSRYVSQITQPGACWNPTQTEQHQGWQLQRRPWLKRTAAWGLQGKKACFVSLGIFCSCILCMNVRTRGASEAVGCLLWVSHAHLNSWGIRRQTGMVSTCQWAASYCEWHQGGDRVTAVWHPTCQNHVAALRGSGLTTGQSHNPGCAPTPWHGEASPCSWASLCPWPVFQDVTGHCF